MQLRAGGTVGGVCAAKVSEAEVMVAAGIPQVLIANQVVTVDKIARLASLARRADMLVACDDPRNADDLSLGAQSSGAVLGVVIEVNTSMRRAGIRAVEQGVQLAQHIAGLPGLPGLRFCGVMSHQTIEGFPDREERFAKGREYMQMVLDVKEAIERTGLPVEVVSTGESWTYDVATSMPGVTEVEGGTYLLMDTIYEYMGEFRIAAKILGTVLSTPRPGVAIGDVSVEAMGAPNGVPRAEAPGVTVTAINYEHTVMETDGTTPLKVGDKYLLHSGQQDIMVNRWDQYVAVRDGLVEAVWDIAARGTFH